MSQDDLFADGKFLRDDGMRRAVEHADRVEEAWSDRALVWVHRVAQTNAVLTAELVADLAHVSGLPRPPEPRAWGAVMMRAAKAGVIRREGYENSQHARAHNRPVTVWRSCLR